jgi:hypothetical protein
MLLLLLAALLPLLAPKPAAACTRVLYQGDNNTVIVGRTLDWLADTRPTLWAFPRGLARNGSAGPGSITWTSKHGSLITAMYDIGTLDGMNEKGLVANALYLVRAGGPRERGRLERVAGAIGGALRGPLAAAHPSSRPANGGSRRRPHHPTTQIPQTPQTPPPAPSPPPKPTLGRV